MCIYVCACVCVCVRACACTYYTHTHIHTLSHTGTRLHTPKETPIKPLETPVQPLETPPYTQSGIRDRAMSAMSLRTPGETRLDTPGYASRGRPASSSGALLRPLRISLQKRPGILVHDVCVCVCVSVCVCVCEYAWCVCVCVCVCFIHNITHAHERARARAHTHTHTHTYTHTRTHARTHTHTHVTHIQQRRTTTKSSIAVHLMM